jgi:membrane-associated protease RseP (regulator of RpoE activity)
MDQFHKYGKVRRALLGVKIGDVAAADAQAAGLKEIRGALVQTVTDGSGAEKAGLKPGDIIVSIDNRPVSSVSTLQRMIFGYQPGSTVTVGYARFGTQGSARVTLQQADEPKETVASADRSAERGPQRRRHRDAGRPPRGRRAAADAAARGRGRGAEQRARPRDLPRRPVGAGLAAAHEG